MQKTERSSKELNKAKDFIDRREQEQGTYTKQKQKQNKAKNNNNNKNGLLLQGYFPYKEWQESIRQIN